MRVVVDQDRCVGAGLCEQMAPEVLEQNDDGLGQVLVAEPPPETWPKVRQAADVCPVRAIRVTGEGAGHGHREAG